MPIYKCPSTELARRDYMQALFSEFLTDDPSTNALPIPTVPANLQATPSIPNTPKTEGGYITEEEQEEGEYSSHPQQQQQISSSTSHNVDDDDVDEYLYGESDTNTKTPKTNEIDDEDEDMDENYQSAVSGPFTEEDMDDSDAATALRGGSVATHSIIEGDDPNDVEQMATDDDYEDDESDSGENIQQNQSYWIFGDSLKRFKEASSTAHTAQKENDQTQYEVHLYTAKKSLKEILDVFLRMAIPAETLVPTIGPYVRNMAATNMLNHITDSSAPTNADEHADEHAVLNDSSKDLFDLIMVTFWCVRDNDASRDKLIRLIGCISHTRKSKSRRHIIGMRWWSFIAV
jgi:integrator complex subunit 3